MSPDVAAELIEMANAALTIFSRLPLLLFHVLSYIRWSIEGSVRDAFTDETETSLLHLERLPTVDKNHHAARRAQSETEFRHLYLKLRDFPPSRCGRPSLPRPSDLCRLIARSPLAEMISSEGVLNLDWCEIGIEPLRLLLDIKSGTITSLEISSQKVAPGSPEWPKALFYAAVSINRYCLAIFCAARGLPLLLCSRDSIERRLRPHSQERLAFGSFLQSVEEEADLRSKCLQEEGLDGAALDKQSLLYLKKIESKLGPGNLLERELESSDSDGYVSLKKRALLDFRSYLQWIAASLDRKLLSEVSRDSLRQLYRHLDCPCKPSACTLFSWLIWTALVDSRVESHCASYLCSRYGLPFRLERPFRETEEIDQLWSRDSCERSRYLSLLIMEAPKQRFRFPCPSERQLDIVNMRWEVTMEEVLSTYS